MNPHDGTATGLRVEPVACPLCSAASHRPWGVENGFSAVRCAECELVYVNPRPSLQEIDEGHRIGKHRTLNGDLSVSFKPTWRNLKGYKEDVRAAFAHEIAAGEPIAWLDVGAGYGEFLKALQETLPSRSRIAGIEPMESKVAYAASLGLPLTTTPLSAVAGPFDVVSILNVFSHVPDFRTFLGELRDLLKPGGSIYLQTGNGGDLTTREEYPDSLFLPDHLVFAGRTHIERFLSEAGFTVAWSAASRKDTLFWSFKSVVKRLVGRHDPIVLPYRSDFRDMRYRAKLATIAG